MARSDLAPAPCISRIIGSTLAAWRSVHVRSKLGNNELHALRHEPGDEVNVAAEAVELGHGNRAASAAGLCKGGGKLWAAVKGVGTKMPLCGDFARALTFVPTLFSWVYAGASAWTAPTCSSGCVAMPANARAPIGSRG
jgi:hypothetical protein